MLLCDYILLSIMFSMALCCTVAVLDSSCNRERGGMDGQEWKYQEWQNGPECRCPVKTGDSYVNRKGNTFVTVIIVRLVFSD